MQSVLPCSTQRAAGLILMAALTSPTGTVTPAASVTKNGIDGWTVGGGIEYKINPNWSVKGEYRYFDFGNVTVDLAPGYSFTHQLTANAVTAGVNYYVGSVYSPLK